MARPEGCARVGWHDRPFGFEKAPSGPGCIDVQPATDRGPGTMPRLGYRECQPVGWTQCPAGFEADPSGWGCREVLPDGACFGAARESLGDRTCRPVGDCNSPWPPAAATHFVDDGFATEDATHHRTLARAIRQAPEGAVIAVDEGHVRRGSVVSAAGDADWPVRPEGGAAGDRPERAGALQRGRSGGEGPRVDAQRPLPGSARAGRRNDGVGGRRHRIAAAGRPHRLAGRLAARCTPRRRPRRRSEPGPVRLGHQRRRGRSGELRGLLHRSQRRGRRGGDARSGCDAHRDRPRPHGGSRHQPRIGLSGRRGRGRVPRRQARGDRRRHPVDAEDGAHRGRAWRRGLRHAGRHPRQPDGHERSHRLGRRSLPRWQGRAVAGGHPSQPPGGNRRRRQRRIGARDGRGGRLEPAAARRRFRHRSVGTARRQCRADERRGRRQQLLRRVGAGFGQHRPPRARARPRYEARRQRSARPRAERRVGRARDHHRVGPRAEPRREPLRARRIAVLRPVVRVGHANHRQGAAAADVGQLGRGDVRLDGGGPRSGPGGDLGCARGGGRG